MTQVGSDKQATAQTTGQEAGSRAAAEAELQQIVARLELYHSCGRRAFSRRWSC